MDRRDQHTSYGHFKIHIDTYISQQHEEGIENTKHEHHVVTIHLNKKYR